MIKQKKKSAAKRAPRGSISRASNSRLQTAVIVHRTNQRGTLWQDPGLVLQGRRMQKLGLSAQPERSR